MRPAVLAFALFALAQVIPRPAHSCELAGTFVGFTPAGVVADLDFVIPVFDDAHSTCGDPVPVMPSPMMAQWVVGTPVLLVGQSYALTLRPGGTLGSHLVVSSRATDAPAADLGPRIPTVYGPVLKPGNDQPPCTVGTWREGAIPVTLEVHSAGSADISTAEDLDAIRAAATEWAAPSGSSASFSITLYDEAVDRGADGRSTLAFVDSGSEIFENLGPENLGFTCVVCDDDGYIIEADVRLNGLDRTWTTECGGVDFDVFGAVLHELGHVLGLAHSDDPNSVMFPVTSARRLLDSRTLARSDVELLGSLYPCEDGACGGQSETDESCPAGAPLCTACTLDEECGAETDRCITDRETGASFCARQCSGSFPCPEGFECVNTGAAQQCVPVDGVCPAPELFVGCKCATDNECGGDADRCLDGRCVSDCGRGLGCPDESSCTAVLDSEGLPLGQLCLSAADLDPCTAPPREPSCGRCGSSDRGGWWLGIALVGITLARRRVLVAIRCR